MFNMAMHDGSRHFGALPQTVLWHGLRDHIDALPGAVLTGFITDGVTEAWIDFTYRDYNFSVNDQFGEYWFFVDRPDCPEDILLEVLEYCGLLLSKREDRPSTP